MKSSVDEVEKKLQHETTQYKILKDSVDELNSEITQLTLE